MKSYFAYIMGNQKPMLYVGVTNDIERRVYEHKNGLVEGHTKQFGMTKLLYLEETNSIEDAIKREKQLKNWHRDWKLNLIREQNPDFDDLVNPRIP